MWFLNEIAILCLGIAIGMALAKLLDSEPKGEPADDVHEA